MEVSKRLGDIMFPVFLVAVGDDADLSFFFSSTTKSKVEGKKFHRCSPNRFFLSLSALRPETAENERIASSGVLPVLLAGVLGSSSKLEVLRDSSMVSQGCTMLVFLYV